MKEIILKAKLLNIKNFTKYGDVFSTKNPKNKTIEINSGYAKKHCDLVNFDLSENNGIASLHIFEAKKRQFPLNIAMLENHPLHSQAFIPRNNTPFIIVVCENNGQNINKNKIEAFITDGHQGINYKRGIWHHPLISLENNTEFIVIDRQENSCVEYCFKDEQKIMLVKDI